MKTLVTLLLFAVSAAAQDSPRKRPMTFADLMAMRRVSDPQVSPSGKWVLFSVTDVSLERDSKANHLWVVPLAGTPAIAPSPQVEVPPAAHGGVMGGIPRAGMAPELPEQRRSAGNERQVTTGSGETNGRFSPDGKWVSYTQNGQVWMAPWDDGAARLGTARHLTAVSAADADGAIWSPDSTRLLFVATVYPECSDKASWYEEDGCDRQMDVAAQSGSQGQLFTGLLYRHWNAFTGKRRSHVLVIGVDGRNVRDLTPASAVGDAETPTFSLGGPLGYAWAPDSKEIAYVTNLDAVKAASTNNDVFTLRLDEPGAKAVKVSTSPGSDDGPQYSPDGKWLAFRSQARAGYESDRFRLMLFDRSKKSLHEAQTVEDLWVDEFTWSPKSDAVFYASGYAGHEDVLTAAPSSSYSLRKKVPSELTILQAQGEVGELCLDGTGTKLIGTRMKADSPAELFVLDLTYPNAGKLVSEWGGEEALTHINDAILGTINLSSLEDFHFLGAEGTKVEGFLVKPPNFDPRKKYPVKFLIHGGPQGAWGDAWSYRWNPELMAASGYVVVMVNPRGSTGYGQAFIDGVNGDWGGKAYIDLMKGLDAAESQFPFIDKSRECALGASYGGFMANWILTHTNRFQCIVTHDGMYNPAAAYGDTEELWFNEWEFRRPGDTEPGQPWRYAALPADQDPFRKWSPMLHIQDSKTPTLVIHSQKDYRLDVSEGFQLFTALQRLHVPSEMLYFPDEGHWVLKPKNSELWNKTVSDWCDKWTHSNAYAAAHSSH